MVKLEGQIPVRWLVAISCAILALGIAYFCTHYWPLKLQKIDPEVTPFFGQQQMNGYTVYSNHITDAKGRFRAHKFVLGLLAIFVVIGGLVGANRKKVKIDFSSSLKTLRHLGGLAGFLIFTFVLMIPFLKALNKMPDFSQRDQGHMALVNMHFSFIVGHADKLADGDRLFESITPKYGMIITVFLAGLQKAQGGLLSLGELIKFVQISEFLYIFLGILLYWNWAGRRWVLILVPIMFLMHWYYSSSQFLVPMNHSPIRTAGITLALVVLFFQQRTKVLSLGFICGLLAAAGILNNVESGVACTVGVCAFLYLRLIRLEKSWPSFLGSLGMLLIGFTTLWSLFSLVCYWVLGVPFGVHGLAEYVFPAFKGASGAWAYNHPFSFWPIFMFLHVALVVIYSAWGAKITFKDAFRCSLGVIFLVWFAYFVSRPEPTYLCSFYFMYGFLIIDLEKTLFREKQRWILLPSAFAFSFIVFQLHGVVHWSVKPWKWQLAINPFKWSVPAVKVGHPLTPDARDIGGAYANLEYFNSLKVRGDFLKDQSLTNSSKRLIYFTVDSFLIPRFSNVLPWQEYPDPLEAMTKVHYDHLIQSVLNSPFDEIYFDARDEKSLVWYGGMFQMVRRDLGEHFQKVGVESGWEIWKRISKN